MHQLQNGSYSADHEDVVFAWIIFAVLLLRSQHDFLVGGHRGFQCFDGFFPRDEQRVHNLGVNDDSAKWQKWVQVWRQRFIHGSLYQVVLALND
jgi:hypothetical protein